MRFAIPRHSECSQVYGFTHSAWECFVCVKGYRGSLSPETRLTVRSVSKLLHVNPSSSSSSATPPLLPSPGEDLPRQRSQISLHIIRIPKIFFTILQIQKHFKNFLNFEFVRFSDPYPLPLEMRLSPTVATMNVTVMTLFKNLCIYQSWKNC